MPSSVPPKSYSSSPRYHVRDAGIVDTDPHFIISAFDSAITFLNPINNGAQWGSKPFTQRENWTAETLRQIEDSIAVRLEPGKKSLLRIFIVEREVTLEDLHRLEEVVDKLNVREADDGRKLLAAGFTFFRDNYLPAYIESQKHLCIPEADHETNVYLDFIATDHRLGKFSKGAGGVLVEAIKDYGVSKGKKKFYLDSWAGSEKKLVRYYKSLGFEEIGDFSSPRKNDGPWLGTLMCMDI